VKYAVSIALILMLASFAWAASDTTELAFPFDTSTISNATATLVNGGMWQYNAPTGPHTRYYEDALMIMRGDDNTDSSPYGEFSSIAEVGSPTYTAGKFGNAITFDGSSDYLMENSSKFTPVLSGCRKITFAFWYKRDTTGGREDLLTLRDSGGSNSVVTFTFNTNDTLASLSGRSGNNNVISTTETYTDTSAFHHIVVTHDVDSPTGDIYHDNVAGTISNSTTGTPDYLDLVQSASVGARTDGSFKYDGQVDSLAMWCNWEMSSAEVAVMYGSPYDIGLTAVDAQTISSQPQAINNSVSFNLNELRLSIESPTSGDPTGGTVQTRIWNGTSYGAWSNVTGSGEGPDDYKPTTSEANVGTAFKVDLKLTNASGDEQFYIDGVRLTGISNTAIGGNGGGQETLMQGGLQ
jgi:hypothetical protein